MNTQTLVDWLKKQLCMDSLKPHTHAINKEGGGRREERVMHATIFDVASERRGSFRMPFWDKICNDAGKFVI